ncbi:PREDICTED: melanoma antigen preferentially expressed in tumors-like [Myotis brandtii]|uniref:melanoma antigen preferentially expressed in tumors-like n=1 Tax=Myotis brandtii TaxID=109478 RepID=UPI000703DAD6|nr:PREDICTED: melanoma antigen preferentially expressed in tumors-like [Myotis brandtii]
MSIRTPPTLLKLAAKRLLSGQASAIAALEYLPAELFPYLFVMAYRGGRRPQLLKALAQAWPFTVLPLGVLMQRPPDHAPTRAAGLKAVFDALDVLLAQERVRRVLDRVRLDCIQKVYVNCTWDLPTLGTLALYLGQMSNLQTLFLLEERKDCIQKVYVNCTWDLPTLGTFALYLGQMSNLQRLYLPHINMLRLRHLWALYMRSPSFLPGRLDQMLRCLQTPLDKLCLTHCQQLTQSDLTHLFQCPNLRQLKILHLFGLGLEDFSEPLRALLEAVASTLQDLGLDKCGMADSQVEAILPALSRCHQLRFFSISMNNFPVATMKKLLRHTTGLRSLEFEMYPIPLECYRTQGTVNQERLVLIQAELTGILRELGQPRTIQLATRHLRHRKFYELAFS